MANLRSSAIRAAYAVPLFLAGTSPAFAHHPTGGQTPTTFGDGTSLADTTDVLPPGAPPTAGCSRETAHGGSIGTRHLVVVRTILDM